MQWFNVEKVTPSKEPLSSKPVLIFDEFVMDEADRALYRMLDYDSFIEVYDRHNYFLARQYAHDRHTNTTFLYAEYRLTLTDEVWKFMDTLLKAPFTCDVKQISPLDRTLHYRCSTQHSAYIPQPNTRRLEKGVWVISILTYPIPRRAVYRDYIYREYTTMSFNCGPLRPLWLQAVECWIEKIRELGSKHVAKIKDALLQYKYLDLDIVPLYRL